MEGAYKNDMSPTLPARKSPLIRSRTKVYPLHLIDQGEVILNLMTSLRFATGGQIQRIFFDRTSVSPRQARDRSTRTVRRLFDAGYLKRVQVFAPSGATGRLSPQIVNCLSAKGAGAVGIDPRFIRSRTPKRDAVLVHEFWLVELGVLALSGCPEGLAVRMWWDDRVLAGRKRRGKLSMSSIPDALLVIENLATGKLYPCLLELDLGTESVIGATSHRRDFRRKIEDYLEYVGQPFKDDFDLDATPIVLIISQSERRLDALSETTRKLGGGGRFWFATLDQLRGVSEVISNQETMSQGLEGPFWAPSWRTTHESGLRTLTSRCRASGSFNRGMQVTRSILG
jgi:hypothetical protein